MRADCYDELRLYGMRCSQTQGGNATVTMSDYTGFLQPQRGKNHGKIILKLSICQGGGPDTGSTMSARINSNQPVIFCEMLCERDEIEPALQTTMKQYNYLSLQVPGFRDEQVCIAS